MSATAEPQTAPKEPETKRHDSISSSPIPEQASESDGGLFSRVFSGAPGEPPGNAAKTLLRSPALSSQSNTGVRVIALSRAQQTHGNRYTQRLVSQIQLHSKRSRVIQRECTCGASCAKCSGTSMESVAASPVTTDEPQRLIQAQVSGSTTSSGPRDQAVVPDGNGQPMDEATRDFMESRFNTDFSDVRVHSDHAAADSAEALDANAYTSGRDIYFAPGKYAPGTTEGDRLIAHELTHTLQQSSDDVPDTNLAYQTSDGVMVGHPNDPLEHEAERAADAAVSGSSTPMVSGTEGAPIVRRDFRGTARDVRGSIGGAATAIVRRQPDTPGSGRPTLQSLIRTNPPGFTDAALDQAYQAYRRGTGELADPRTWALYQTTGGPRMRLEQLLGPDYARGQLTGAAAPPIDVRQATAPQGYDPARQAADVAALNADPTALAARLQRMAETMLGEGQVSAGHFNILQGNVGEILARPLLNQALEEVRREAPDAQLYTGVRARIMRSDGTPSDPVLFTDGLIAAVRPAGLQIFRVAEIKSGEAGGVQGQEQIHRWIERHASDTIEILLPGVARTFRLSDTVREVVGLARAPRLLIAPRGAQFTTERSGHRVAAPVQRLELSQSAEEIDYLTRVIAQQLLQVQQARRLLAQAREHQLAPGVVERIEELQSPTVVRRLLAENNGTALVRGQLYRVSIEGTSIRVRTLPASTIAVPRLPAAVGGVGSGTATPVTPLGTPTGGRTGPAAGQAVPALPPPGGAGGPVEVPLPLPATGVVPPNIINFTGTDIVVGGRTIGPTPQAETLREGELIVVGFDRYWAVGDARTRQPIAGVFEGGQWYRVVSGGRVLPLDAEGRIRTEVEPIPFSQLPAVAQRQPPAGPGGAAGGQAGAGARVVAGGLGLIVLANEILGSIGQVLQLQRRNIEFGRAEINFWIQFGANPRFGVWSQNDRVPLPADAVPETAIFSSPSFPYVADIDVNAFRGALPGLIGTYRDLLLFLDLAKTLGTIVEDPLMPQFPSPDERRQPRRYYALVNKHEPGGRIRYDITDLITGIRDRTVGMLDEQMRARVRGLASAEQRNIFRLRAGSATPLFRSARGGQPILSDEQLLGDDPWVHPVGRRIEGSRWGWFRYAGGGSDRVLVEPANADAARGTVVTVYAVKSEIDEVLDEIREAGRPIIQRQPPEGRLESFVAGPDPEGTRFGETRYYRHPEQPNNQTAAIGELKQFWVNGADLQPVTEADVTAYANPPASSAPTGT